MCGIAGIIDFKDKDFKSKNYNKNIKEMIKTLERRGPNTSGIFESDGVVLGHRRLAIIDVEKGLQPMTREYNKNKYTIVYNGELYNTNKLRQQLEKRGFKQTTNCDTETLLLGYICFGKQILNKIIGIFAFAIYDENKQKLILVRDNFGVKPLYYTLKNDTLIFGSEQKTILASGLIKAQIDKTGLQELFALSPLKTPGITIFKDVLELKSGEMAEFDKSGFKKSFYYKIKAKKHTDDTQKTIKKVKSLVENSIKSQLVSDVGICSFLSGGLDSSIITAVASKQLKKQNKKLNTYSLDYENNSKFFKPSAYQPNKDSDFIGIMTKAFNTRHTNFILSGKTALSDALFEATIARDGPGMADIDSSLFLFCKEIKKDYIVALSGECADEIFCGYPWFWKKDLIEKDFFPFLNQDNEKLFILKQSFLNEIKPLEYAKMRYQQTIDETPLLGTETLEEKRLRQIQFLTIKWFMQSLLERKDKISMFTSLEVRVPFCDRRIVDYVYNIPFDLKLLNGREKGLLREAVSDLLPKEIVERKKSPYPKTHNPEYYKIVVKELKRRLSQKDCKLKEFIDMKKLKKLMSSPPDLSKPFVGQLMARPQLFASLIQMDILFKTYDVEILI